MSELKVASCFEFEKVLRGKSNKLFYPKSEVDAFIAELKTKLEDVQATAYAESVDAGMRERKLKRALYKACANWAHEKDARYYLEYVCISDDARIQYERWRKMENKCRAKAEEYK